MAHRLQEGMEGCRVMGIPNEGRLLRRTRCHHHLWDARGGRNIFDPVCGISKRSDVKRDGKFPFTISAFGSPCLRGAHCTIRCEVAQRIANKSPFYHKHLTNISPTFRQRLSKPRFSIVDKSPEPVEESVAPMTTMIQSSLVKPICLAPQRRPNG